MDASILQYATDALVLLLTGPHLFYLLLGVALGLTIGLIPGLGGIAGMALVLPFLFGMEPGAALAMMIGLTSTTSTSDTFLSVLVGVPGGSSAQATVLDGFPLAKKGQAARALSAAFFASMIGGIFGALVLSLAFVVARPILLAVGFGEQLMLVILALTLVGMLTGPSMSKGLASCAIGLLLGTIGASQATAEFRFTFGSMYLSDGLPLVVVALGIFAFPEIIDVLRRHATIASGATAVGSGWLQGIKDVVRNWWLVLRCSSIGSIVGFLPGLGGSVIDWIAYGHVVQTSRDKSQFGKGDIRGVIGPESAANAKEGGALIPTLFFGIPGSGTMALLLGGLIVIGITPGRTMVTQHVDLVYLIIWSIALANIIGTGVSMMLARPIASLTRVNFALLAPFILVMVFFAAFQSKQDWGDLFLLTGIGVLGIYMKRFGWSRAALLIGFVLSQRLEASLYRTVQIYGFDIFLRPISLVILALAALSLYFALRSRSSSSSDVEEADQEASRRTIPAQLIFAGALVVGAGAIAVDVWGLRFLASVFPLSVAAILVGFTLFAAFKMFRRSEYPGIVYDAEATPGEQPKHSILFFLLWILLLPTLTWFLGFLVAAPIYVAIFIRVLAGTSLLKAILGALAVFAVLMVVGQGLDLLYPQGVLERYIPLPARLF